MLRSGLIVLVIAVLFALSCSSDSSIDPVASQLTENSNFVLAQVEVPRGHSLLGLQRITINALTEEVSAVPLRSSQWHLNAIRFIEPPSGGSLLSFSNIEITGHMVGIDVTLKHPFGGLPYYCGFDVKGIILGAADTVDANADDRIWAGGPNGLRLMNADGWTRWWNPIEFPDNDSIFSYRKGIYSTTGTDSVWFATLSGYKVFAASLEPDDQLNHVLAVPLTHPNGRAVFNASGIETRHYDLVFPGDGSGYPNLVFDYAVDVSHGFPPDYEPGEYIDVPSGFPPEANQPEPFILDVLTPVNTVYLSQDGCTGGLLEMTIRVSDWQALLRSTPVADEISSIELTSPTLFIGTRTAEFVSDWTHDEPWATYKVELDGITPDSVLDQQVLITVNSAIGDYQPEFSSYTGDAQLATYYVARVPVTATAPIGETGFSINSLSPWPKPGGNIHNSNVTKTYGPAHPEVAWEICGTSSDAMPVVDPEGRVFATRELDPAGVGLMGFDSNGNQVADVENDQFAPEASPMLVGCSLFWNDSEGRVIKLYQDGDHELFFSPVNGAGPYSFGMLNIDDDNHGIVHGPLSVQAFDNNGQLAWLRYGLDDTPSLFVGAPTVAGDGRIVVGKVDLDTSPPSNFEFWGLDPDSGEIKWVHDPEIDGASVFGCAADPAVSQIYYTINNLVVAIDEKGEKIWEFEGTGYFLDQLAISYSNTIYAAESVPGQTGGTSRIVAIPPDGLTELWDYTVENGITAGPITDVGGNVYFATSDSIVRCVNQDGQLVWSLPVEGHPVYIIFGPAYSVLVGVKETPYETTILCLSD